MKKYFIIPILLISGINAAGNTSYPSPTSAAEDILGRECQGEVEAIEVNYIDGDYTSSYYEVETNIGILWVRGKTERVTVENRGYHFEKTLYFPDGFECK